jgi:hypothetical protein
MVNPLPRQDNSCISPYGAVIVTISGRKTHSPATICNNDHLVYDNILLRLGKPFQMSVITQDVSSDLLAIDPCIKDQNGGW